MKIIEFPSPNFDTRGEVVPTILVLHYTGMPSGQAAIDWLANPQSGVSSHYVVEENGDVFRLVAEEQRAWHAGVSSWRGKTALNAHSIGIEIVNPGHEWGYRAFPDVQMVAVKDLCFDILSRHAIEPRNVIGHSDIAPLRKIDPGELFDWKYLSSHGIGIMPEYNESDFAIERHDIALLQEELSNYGYGLPITGIYDDLTIAVVKAFQRHFYPQNVTGIANIGTRLRLDQLFKIIGA
jgi:N-acetylmuramoyl-L-alanine amidase